MTRFLALLAALVAVATPAAADPVSGLITLGTTLFAGATFGSVAANLLGAVAMTALQAALAAKERRGAPSGGIKTESTTAGEEQPQTIVFGRYATAGNHEAPPYAYGISGDGNPVENLAYIVSLSDYPIDGLESVIVNGKNCAFDIDSTRDGGIYGKTTKEYDDRAFLRWHDGRQTTADAMLLSALSAHPHRPWSPTAILSGVAYATMTFKYDTEVWTGLPEVRFVVRGARLYDPRKDSSVGGSGAQRWANPSTWTFTENPVIQIYNLLRGLTLADGTVYGLGIPAERLPLATWAAAANACDEEVSVSGGGTRKRYRAGLEFSVDQEPLDVIEEIGKACGATLAEIAGAWRIVIGEPEVVSAYITDDDIIITSPEQFDPFPNLSETYNAAAATYPKPSALWETAEAKPIYRPAWEAEDGGRRLVADLTLSAVSDGRQVRALMRETLTDHRRMRTHQITLPPKFLSLSPTKTISWTSSHNGYSTKLFEITAKSIDPLTLCSTFTLRERDPSDYSPNMLDDAVLPSDPSVVVDPPTRVGINMFAVAGTSIPGADGTARRPALRLSWDPEGMAVSEIAYEVRVEATGTVISAGKTTDVARGQLTVASSILPNTLYGARARAVGRRKSSWSAWATATTPDTRLKADDIESSITTSIAEAQAAAAAALGRVSGVDNDLDRALALANASANVDAALARVLAGGWAVQPTFRDWTAGAPAKWSAPAGVSKLTTGWLYDTSAQLESPNSGEGSISARYGGSGQIFASADLRAEYVVVSAMIEWVSGPLTAGWLGFEWKGASGGFVLGTTPLNGSANVGRLDAIGLKTTAGTRQVVQVLFRRPSSIAAAAVSDMRLILRVAAGTGAGKLRVVAHSLDARAATEQEIDQTLVRAYADAAITSYDTTIQGLLGAGSFSTKSVAARFGEVEGSVSDLSTVVANGNSALASRLITVEARNTDGNLCRNPQFGGGAPTDWISWPSAWSVVARGPGAGAAMGACPAPYAALLAVNADSAQFAAFAAGVPVKKGDRFQVRMDYATGGNPRDAGLYIRASWILTDGSSVRTYYGVAGASLTSWTTYEREITAPENAESVTFSIYRSDGGSGEGFIANPYVARRDASIANRLDAIVALKASAGDPAVLELVSTATDGLLSSTARIKASNILLDGSVAARSLVVGDFSNLVPDNQLQDMASWSAVSGTWSNYPTTALGGTQSIGEMRAAAGADTARLTSRPFPATPSAIYAVSYQVRRTGGTAMNTWAQVRWYDGAGELIKTDTIDSYNGASASTLSLSGTSTAPGAASYGTLSFFAGAGDSGVRFFGPSVRRQVQAVEIKDGAITADKITAGAIKTNHLEASAITADKIAADTIVAEKIKVGAVGKFVSTSNTTSASLTTSDVSVITIPLGQSYKSQSSFLLNASCGYETSDGPVVVWKINVNGSTIFTYTIDHNNAEVLRTISFAHAFKADAGDTITITVQRTNAGGGSGSFVFCRAALLVVL